MPSFRYKALTKAGEIVSGSITAASASEVAHRIEYLGLIPIDTVGDEKATPEARRFFGFLSRPRYEDITFFTGDLALLLKTGARINEALELVAGDADLGRMRPAIAKITSKALKLPTKVRTATSPMTGIRSGILIFQNIWNLVAPSITAAS